MRWIARLRLNQNEPTLDMIVEQHGIVEVGQFTRVLFNESKPLGFNYFCLETDPFIAQKLEALTRSGLAALQTFNREFPLLTENWIKREA